MIKPFDRVAQLIIMPITRIAWNHVLDSDTTERNSDGFGSTGISR
jgi:dUTPase